MSLLLKQPCTPALLGSRTTGPRSKVADRRRPLSVIHAPRTPPDLHSGGCGTRTASRSTPMPRWIWPSGAPQVRLCACKYCLGDQWCKDGNAAAIPACKHATLTVGSPAPTPAPAPGHLISSPTPCNAACRAHADHHPAEPGEPDTRRCAVPSHWGRSTRQRGRSRSSCTRQRGSSHSSCACPRGCSHSSCTQRSRGRRQWRRGCSFSWWPAGGARCRALTAVPRCRLSMAASRCIQCCFHARFLACYVTAVLWGLCNCNSREQERRLSRAWHAVPAVGRAGGWGAPPADQGRREKEKGWGRQGGLARRGRTALYGVWGGVGTVRMQLSISQMKGGRPTRGGQAGGTGGCRTLLASRSCWQGWRGSGGGGRVQWGTLWGSPGGMEIQMGNNRASDGSRTGQ